jgi:7-cyano-7-deazaguanine synthase
VVQRESHLILLSGGLDSAALLYATPLLPADRALFVDYGQVAAPAERRAARALAARRGIVLLELDLPNLREIGAGAAVQKAAASAPDGTTMDQRSEWFPLRNLLLITVAAAITARDGGGSIGFGAADPIYRDTQPAFFEAAQQALGEALPIGLDVTVEWAGAKRHVVLAEAVAAGLEPGLTFSCNTRGDRHCWRCASCRDREAFLRSLSEPR